MRTKKAIYNTIAGYGYELTLIACSFIVPRLILTGFGSDYNGLTSAISQFLHMVVLLQAGIGGVIKAALYKPLAENDNKLISIIIRTTRVYIQKIAFFYVIIVLAIAVLYPFAVSEDFDWFFVFTLVLILSFDSFIKLFFSAGYGYLIGADQKQSVAFIISIIALILSTTVSVIMINAGFSIHAVKMGAALAYGIRPVMVYIYIHKRYKLDKKVNVDNSYLKQRWDNFAQEVAGFFSANTPLIVISVFTNVYEVSVFTVYMLVANGIHGIIRPLFSGVDAAFGNMFALDEQDNIQKGLRVFELVIFASVTLLLGVTAVMFVPFIMLYTQGVTDVDYNRQLLSIMIVAATMFRCFRVPYYAVVAAAGHFRQTRNGAIVEMSLNIIVSVLLVFNFGIVGVVAGTFISLAYRTVQFAVYVSKNLVNRSIFAFIKRLFFSLSGVAVIAASGHYLKLGFDMLAGDIVSWIINAVLTTLIAMAVTVTIEMVFYRDDVKTLFVLLKKGVKTKTT